MAVSGLLMLAFVIVHMAGNLKIFFGEQEFDSYAHWLRTIGEPMTSADEVRLYLDIQARNNSLGEKKAKEDVTVIIRADKDAKFMHIHKTMMAIKAAGFKKLQLRAEVAQG